VIKYVDFDFVPGADGVKVIRPLKIFFTKLFYYFLHSVELPEKGYARHFQFLEKSYIPLPPLPEQQRIVAKIEELFTRLDAGVEALKKAKEQIKRYRQAVLKYAFEGKLTEEWRVRANQERTNNVVGAIHELPLQNGKKYKELPPVNTSELPELPEGWVWVRLGEVCEVTLGKTPNKSQYVNKGRYKIVKFRDVTNRGINYDEDERGFVIENGKVISELVELQERDILVTASAHSSEHIGKKVVYVSKIPKRYEKVFFVGELLCVRNRDNNIEPRTIYYYLMSQDGYKSIQKHVRGVHLITSEARQIPIPLPPLPEQQKIVEEIERRFSVVDEVEKAIDKSLKEAERLRQSILKKAFEGKLVPQDPNDEPAEKLLERIKNRRAESRKGNS